MYNVNDSNLCEYPTEYYDCNENCISDIDLDGVCDESDTAGCTNEQAANYNPYATEDDGSCVIIGGCNDVDANNYTFTAAGTATANSNIGGGSVSAGPVTLTP